MTSTQWNETPTISSVSINFIVLLNAPEAALTDIIDWPDYNRPSFWWPIVTGASSYLFQLDNASSFDSPNLVNVTSSNSYHHQPALTNGTYYWRVAGIDSEGDLGVFSDTGTLNIGTTSTPTTTTGTTADSSDLLIYTLIAAVGIAAVVVIIMIARRRSN